MGASPEALPIGKVGGMYIRRVAEQRQDRTQARQQGGRRERMAVKNQSLKYMRACLRVCETSLTAVWLGFQRLKRIKDGGKNVKM